MPRQIEQRPDIRVIHPDSLAVSQTAASKKGVELVKLAGPGDIFKFNAEVQPDGVELTQNQMVVELKGEPSKVGEFSVLRLVLLREKGMFGLKPIKH